MGRIRTAFISGVTTNNPLTSGGTTLNSASLAGLPVIAAPDIAVIVLDPAGSAGNPEVVYVTAHSSAATSATIARAKESTSAREHAVGTPWVHAPTLTDFEAAIPEYLHPLLPFSEGFINATVSANVAYLCPIVPLTANVTVTALTTDIFTQAGNIDVGIYEWDGTTMTRVVSLGSTACPAAGNAVFDITDTALYRGTRYFFALAGSDASMSVMQLTAPTIMTLNTGYSKTASFPLPATLTSLSNNGGTIPVMLGRISGGIAV